MYRLREMDVDDKVCEQVSMTMLSQVYPKEVIERCVQQSEPWSTKVRRVRLSTATASPRRTPLPRRARPSASTRRPASSQETSRHPSGCSSR